MDFNKLIEALNSPVETDRLYAAEDLGDVNDEPAALALAGWVVVEPSRAVKEAIFHALARMHNDAVVQSAVAMLSMDDAFIRNEAVRLLGAYGADAMPALMEAVVDDDHDVRKFALDAMTTIDSDLKDDVYRRLLEDEDLNLVITVVECIGRESKVRLRESVELVLATAAHPMLISACIAALTVIGNAGSLDAIYQKLGGEGMPDFHVPAFIRAVASLGASVHIELLCRFVERHPPMLVDAGFDAIESIRRRIALPQASPALLEAARSAAAQCSDPIGRFKSMQVMAKLADDVTVESIRQHFKSDAR